MTAHTILTGRRKKRLNFSDIVAKKVAAEAAAGKPAKPKSNLPTIGRRLCKNCGKWMKLTKQNTKQKKFCGASDPGKGKCQHEWHQNGGTAFGPLKERVERLVLSMVDDRLAELVTGPAFRELLARAGLVTETDFRNLQRDVGHLEGQEAFDKTRLERLERITSTVEPLKLLGFIHRSQVKKRPLEYSSLKLRESIDDVARILGDLQLKVDDMNPAVKKLDSAPRGKSPGRRR